MNTINQKPVFKVMFIMLLMFVCIVLVNIASEYGSQIYKENIMRTYISESEINCIKRQTERDVDATSNVVKNNPDLKADQRKLELIGWAALISYVFIVYLFSGFIVRLLSNEASNKALKQGASHGTAEKRAAP